MNYLACDPGLATGWAARSGEQYASGQADPGEFGDLLEDWTARHPGGVLVMEKYVITAQTLKLSRQYWSLELIGVGRHLARKHGCEFVLQAPADAKRVVTDARLKQLGLYEPGSDHARDAMRHLVVILAKRGVVTLPV